MRVIRWRGYREIGPKCLNGVLKNTLLGIIALEE